MLNFSLSADIKEQQGGKIYPIEIIGGNYVKSAEFVDQYEAIDIIFYNPEYGYEYRERIFKPSETPMFGTPEEELLRTQRKLKHILNRFMSDEESSYNAISWKDLALKFCAKLMDKSKDVSFELKFIFNKDMTFPALGNVPFMRTEGEERQLAYSKWEKENRLIKPVETSASSGVVTAEKKDDEEIF